MDSKSKQIKEELACDSLTQPANNLIQSFRVFTLLKGWIQKELQYNLTLNLRLIQTDSQIKIKKSGMQSISDVPALYKMF